MKSAVTTVLAAADAAGVAAADAARPRLRLLVIPASSKSLTSTFFVLLVAATACADAG